MSKTSMPIASMRKNLRGDEIRVSLDFFAGAYVFNTRVFFETTDGAMRPGKDGFAIKLDKLEEYAAAVTTALMTAKSKGLLK
ncbi:hypothetical protein IG197_01915 [Aminobacter sp. SR38]|jgi:hypothetical protein|uniref:PC4/YdbC family ssDNA-binding protein n=1 Tax=Aminobacter sp. SR38 TaxID=2774562 RepID=UPI00177BE419|nr:PC4/YdbC family ssDNA-binding protein [Aminobacter sp. SR38]QOF71874.1 hypothetical protein IG197_01915 [Aminobacter sp. SR38]